MDLAIKGALLLALRSLLVPAAEAAAPCPVDGMFPASGETTAYTAILEGGSSAVAVPDDGTVQAGAAARFRDLGNGSILDQNTRLVWEKKGKDGGLHDVDNGYVWSNPVAPGAAMTIWDWLAQVNAEGGTGFAGMSDWRIPNVKELLSLVDFEDDVPLVAPGPFNTNCTDSCSVLTCSCNPGGLSWSSTTAAIGSSFAWNVSLDGSASFREKTDTVNVRAVRGGCTQ